MFAKCQRTNNFYPKKMLFLGILFCRKAHFLVILSFTSKICLFRKACFRMKIFYLNFYFTLTKCLYVLHFFRQGFGFYLPFINQRIISFGSSRQEWLMGQKLTVSFLSLSLLILLLLLRRPRRRRQQQLSEVGESIFASSCALS